MTELWECENCERLVTLNDHGRCEHCDSDQVFCVGYPVDYRLRLESRLSAGSSFGA